MGTWLVGADVLARSRFRVSALAEVVGTVKVLTGGPNRPGQLTGPAPLRARFRERIAADPVAAPFLRGAFLTAWIADLLDWVRTEAVAPDWVRRTRAFEADIVARTRRLSTGGWAGALDDMRPGMRWLGAGRLQINVYDYPPHDLAGGELLFVPATTTAPRREPPGDEHPLTLRRGQSRRPAPERAPVR